MPSSRPSSRGSSGPRGAATRPTRPRAGGRPAPRPGQRPALASARKRTAAGASGPHRPRFTSRAAVLILVLGVLTVSYASSLRAYVEQRAHLADLRESIAESEENIADLRREKRRWDDAAYVEAQATQRFGWVMPGEVGFQVIGRDGQPLGHEDSLSDPESIEVSNEPAWWETAWETVELAGHPEDVPEPVEQIVPPEKKKQ